MEPTYKIAQRLHARRAAKGLDTYGRHLDANSQGCMLVHALEEAADQLNYLLAEIQRRRKLLLDIAEWTCDLDGVEGAEIVRANMIMTYLDLGGASALKQYDEILGGGTIAENATVDPRDEAMREEVAALCTEHNATVDERDALAATPAQSLAAHDAALLRRLAAKLDGEGHPANEYYRNWLIAEADRIEKEAANG